ncbi:MAG: hypothetical protein ACI4JD_07385 [Ruminococcus sp.]
MKNKKTFRKTAAVFASVIAASLPMWGSITASATTVSDVIAAAYAAGWPDWMVQQAINTYSGGNYTSEQCDKAISMIYQYNEEAGKKIEEELGIKPPAATTAPKENENSSTTTVTTNRKSDDKFINASLEEKKNYLNSMTEKEKQEFINSMTQSERNSILKQLSASDKAELLANFMDVGSEFGISFNIDEVSGDNLVVSAVDENGKLVNVTSMSVTVDPTGHSYTVPIIVSGGMLLLSAGGIALITKSKKNKE